MNSHPFFHSTAWFSVLEKGFNAQSIKLSFYGSLAFTLFKKGPFRLAYVNFPIGLVSPEEANTLTESNIVNFLKSHGVHVLNFSTPFENYNYNFSKNIFLPETIIENLGNWDASRLPADVRYEIRRSQREGLRTQKVAARDSKYLYMLYKATIARHGGQTRYTPEYFHALANLAEHDQNLDCRLGFSSDRDEPCAFIVVAHDGDTAYYLHGGYDARYAYLRSGYGLMSLAIAHARDSGCERFNLMASPVDQPALVRFKEKWGGFTKNLLTYRQPLNFSGKVLIKTFHLINKLKWNLLC